LPNLLYFKLMKKSYLIFSLILVFLLSLFIFQKINLVTADLGRHITNGKIFLFPENFNASLNMLLHSNFFSFTNPNFPFINHHWASGILFYMIFALFGFDGLSLFYGGCIIFSTIILFYLWRNKLPVYVSFPIMLLLIPLIGERTEVRPEGLSYLFISLIITLLHLYVTNQIQKKWLYLIPIISLLFVNTHIYFIFSPFIIVMFVFEELIHKNFVKSKDLTIILVLSTLALCINPFGFKELIYPFTIFNSYGYLVVENMSIPFLTTFGINNPNFLWWKIITAFAVFSSVIVFLKHRRKIPVALLGISTTFAILSFFSIRHLTAYGLTLIPLFLCYANLLYAKLNEKEELELHAMSSVAFSIVILIFIIINFWSRLPWNSNWGIGLLPEINKSADFFKMQNISGPIFSNYDIGGYLIFHLYPTEKVFVDNRPEAYPASFLQNEYVQMQNNEKIWKKQLTKWNFNAIYFYRLDITPWAQKFLIERIKDPLWAPIFVDDYTIIFLRKNQKNAEIIKEYELPKNMFSVY